MKNILLIATLSLFAGLELNAGSRVTQEHKDRAVEIVRQMTLEEKIDYIGGYESWYIRGVERLGIPAVRMADGPQGVRNNTKSTLYPSGKLPISIEKKLEDNPSYPNYYENVDRIRPVKTNPYSRVEYREGIFVGYRGYEKNGVEPLFPFGYGLSYTSFEYSDIKVAEQEDEFVVTFNVKNIGEVAGAEVAQVYVTDNECQIVRPVKELKNFEKVFLKPGDSKTITLKLGYEAFRYYDAFTHGFVVDPGQFTISVGSSSADIRLKTMLEVK